jgi:hypothetical protein
MRSLLLSTNPKASLLAFALVGSLLLLGCGSRTAVSQVQEIPEDLVAMISLRNPKDFFSDITNVIHQTDPSGALIKNFTPALQVYGYPDFTAFDPLRRMGIFGLTPLSEENELEWFLMATIQKDAPILQNLRAMGAAIIQVGSWTLAAQNNAVFDRIENIYQFAELLETHPDEDLTLRLFPSALSHFQPAIRNQASLQMLSSNNPPDHWVAYLDWVFTEMRGLHALGAGLDISPKNLKFSYVFEGQMGSPLATMIQNLPHQDELSAGAFIEAGKIANFVTRIQPNAVKTYLETLYHNLLAVAQSDDKKHINSVWENAAPLLENFGPTNFMAFDRLSEPMQYTQLSQGTINRERFLQAYEWFYNNSWQQAMNVVIAPTGEDPMPKMKAQLTHEADSIQGVLISNLKFNLDDSISASSNNSESTALLSDLSHFFAIHDGSYFAASELDALKKILLNYLQKDKTTNNLQNRFLFKKNDLLRGNLDLAIVILQTLTELEQNGITTEPWLNQLFTNSQLDMLFHGYVLQNNLILVSELPVDTVIQLVTRGFTLFMMQALSGR